ncbi:hypothetical protein, partial [Burkholderia vietnamiensis]|uniref:hypothetical protein n=1 Tax=Burkholderia vietnamiensis TaxID=60552 RepID=UPI001CC61391
MPVSGADGRAVGTLLHMDSGARPALPDRTRHRDVRPPIAARYRNETRARPTALANPPITKRARGPSHTLLRRRAER